MSYAVVGFGKIGQALTDAFARSGIEVSVATTGDPESLCVRRSRDRGQPEFD